MARIGMFCLPVCGHVTPFCGLAQELARRGHEPVLFHLPEFSQPIRLRGFRFEAYGESTHPPGTFAELYRELSRLDGLRATKASLDILRLQAEVLFAEARPVIERARPDLWIVDQVDYAAATLAAHMRAPFSWELLTEKPLVYACFGTTQNRNRHLYAALTQAVGDMDVQVVLSLGGAEPSELPERLPGNILVSPFAPQVELLERARLAITQAGMNSALECRSAGVPMVAVPIAHDQPGISAR